MAVLVPAERAADAWAQLAKAATPIGFLAFDTLRVEAGEPWFGIDTDERTIPLEAGLERAIHFNKGCYPGQETIARITNLGHPARQMLGVRWNSEDPPPAGPIFVGEAEAGRLTSSTYSPRLAAAIGLAMMKWAHRAPGTSVHTADGTAGTLVALPFNWTPA